MTQPKPVKYPNIMDQLKSVVEAHAAIHAETATHAEEHRKALDDKRGKLHVQHLSKALIESDGKS